MFGMNSKFCFFQLKFKICLFIYTESAIVYSKHIDNIFGKITEVYKAIKYSKTWII